MISYILPFFHKSELFKAALQFNAAYRHPEAEVICVLDEPTEEQKVLEIVRSNPDVKWRVIVNDIDHPWRPPCVAYNVGIRHALGSHVALFDPESILMLPSPGYLHVLINDYQAMFSGLAWHVIDALKGVGELSLLRRCVRAENMNPPCMWGFGFLLAPRYDISVICGFDESRMTYGADDNDIRIRLSRYGVMCHIDPVIKVFHLWHEGSTERDQQFEPAAPGSVLRHQEDSWGKEFNRIAFDYALK